ncbi:PilZ domain-containing protein [Granulosicoccaceae sp. 1_MG-2023]|nr:PilZ domain-containing protein [Granulosicoccaceae sp. 1_MG-2023]
MATAMRFSNDQFTDRRGSARVTDAVGLDVRLQGEERRAGSAQPAVGAPARFAGFAELERTHPEAVAYILSLESQLGLISRQSADAARCQFPTHKVSLSLSGIAFAHDRVLQPGDRIVLDLVLFPAQQPLSLPATVVSVGGTAESGRSIRGGKYAARAAFSRLDETQRAVLDAHIQGLLSQL